MHKVVGMFVLYLLCVSSDISHVLYYTILGFLAFLEFEINYFIQYTWILCSFSVHVVAWKVGEHLP